MIIIGAQTEHYQWVVSSDGLVAYDRSGNDIYREKWILPMPMERMPLQFVQEFHELFNMINFGRFVK